MRATSTQVYLPESLDLDAHIQRYPPNQVDDFKKDTLVYILSLLLTIPANNKRIAKRYKGWVPISSAVLARREKKYRQYLDYALGKYYPEDEKAAIIETDKQYTVGDKSIAYRFTKHYAVGTDIKPVEITSKTLVKGIRKEVIAKRRDVEKIYPKLVRWFNSCLNIDAEAALEYAGILRRAAYAQAIGRITDNTTSEANKAEALLQVNNKYISYLYNINRIKERNFFLSVDSNVRRFHSNLTNLKSELRNFLTYDGQQLVSIDIKNSQPFLSLALFNPDFFQVPTTRDKADSTGPEEATKSTLKRTARRFDVSRVAPEIYEVLRTKKGRFKIPLPLLEPKAKKEKNTTLLNSFIMFSESMQLVGNEDVGIFKYNVANGVLYEEFMREVEEKIGVVIGSRKEAKKAMFTVLFSDNRSTKLKPKRLFKEIYPTVYEYFSLIKRKDSTVLPRLLQSIESWLILDVVCGKISREKPQLPLFTIHDSIVTTVGNEDYVVRVMEAEIKRHIKYKPQLEVSYFDPRLLDK